MLALKLGGQKEGTIKFVNELLTYDPSARPSAGKALRSRWWGEEPRACRPEMVQTFPEIRNYEEEGRGSGGMKGKGEGEGGYIFDFDGRMPGGAGVREVRDVEARGGVSGRSEEEGRGKKRRFEGRE